jgi:hypothetical protein
MTDSWRVSSASDPTLFDSTNPTGRQLPSGRLWRSIACGWLILPPAQMALHPLLVMLDDGAAQRLVCFARLMRERKEMTIGLSSEATRHRLSLPCSGTSIRRYGPGRYGSRRATTVHELLTNALKFGSLSNSYGVFAGIATELRELRLFAPEPRRTHAKSTYRAFALST